jgi:hypothetical protein
MSSAFWSHGTGLSLVNSNASCTLNTSVVQCGLVEFVDEAFVSRVKRITKFNEISWRDAAM